ncbi:tRNA pseudouridine(38-40) synthase TruA [Prosthecomicrobium hirschii]|uniref:tRNA pseudouridine(38-40) synthase TruA n=1 Tax=Prosthecodimorpha hirschii TaxID=665126 RepID=UPI0022207B5F|nr:tRNA pseudouridine(38-40) synthase TruA [Prosthecomicrobium hirschii]MCW1841100.1 tRNA pseudouridine(38-40) synthase TruA [Prosthecomicrobium hirschii]
MARFKLTIEYDGTPYVGWQRQSNGASVQGALEAAILAMTGETVTLRGAGRTDAGVHATGQVAHVDLAKDWRPAVVRDGLNAHLVEESVVVLAAERVADDFDSRFSARGRHYIYRILDRRPPPALDRRRVWHRREPLDVEAMNAGARHLLGHHDFTTFRSANCQSKSPMKTLDRLEARRVGDLIEVRADARSFLHNQVRSMVGTLERVGLGAWPPERVAEALAARDRAACAAVAPPWGLYLVGVDY